MVDAKEKHIQIEARVVSCLSNGYFSLAHEYFKLKGYLSGKMRTRSRKIVPGDMVYVQVTPYDTSTGRIVGVVRK